MWPITSSMQGSNTGATHINTFYIILTTVGSLFYESGSKAAGELPVMVSHVCLGGLPGNDTLSWRWRCQLALQHTIFFVCLLSLRLPYVSSLYFPLWHDACFFSRPLYMDCMISGCYWWCKHLKMNAKVCFPGWVFDNMGKKAKRRRERHIPTELSDTHCCFGSLMSV